MNLYQKIFGKLNAAKVQYIVVGGVAMNLHGHARFTGDIDILIALDEKNLDTMAKLMKKMHYEPRLPLQIMELGDEQKAVQLIKKNNLIAFTYINTDEPQYNIDVIVGPSLRYNRYKKHIQKIRAWNIHIPVISIDDLIEMKQNSDRKKDADDVQALLELKGL